MAHKNSRGDKDSKGCEIGADTPHARRKKGFTNTSSRMSLVLHGSRMRGFGFGRRTDTLSRSGIDSRRSKPKTRTLLDQALNFKAPSSKLE